MERPRTRLSVAMRKSLCRWGEPAGFRPDRELQLPCLPEPRWQPRQRPQPPQCPGVQVRGQVLRGGRLDKNRAVQADNPSRGVKVVDGVPRPGPGAPATHGARRRTAEQAEALRDRIRALMDEPAAEYPDPGWPAGLHSFRARAAYPGARDGTRSSETTFDLASTLITWAAPETRPVRPPCGHGSPGSHGQSEQTCPSRKLAAEWAASG